MKEILKQTDANSCLACCLLFIAGEIIGQRFSRDDERRLAIESFGLCRENFAMSYFLAFKKLFPELRATITIDNEPYREYLEGLSNGGIRIETEPITMELIQDNALSGPLILCVDRYFFDYEIHIPHYVVVRNQGNNNFLVSDPWRGEALPKSQLEIQEAVFGVKYILGWAPSVIKIDRQSV